MSYAIFVGRERSADGHGFLAGYGDEPSSHWLEVVPRRRHPAGSVVEVGVTPLAAMPGVRSEIPQAEETARHLRVSYSYYLGVPAPITNGGVNEHGVAVRDVWSPSSDRLVALTPPDQTGPNYSDLARIVLERARSAREGVELIGELIALHGESTYGGNSHLIADADEAWVVIEFAGGAGLWVAERLGGDQIRVSRPGYILDVPADFTAHPGFMGAPHLIEFAVDRGWYRPGADGPFNVNAVYGDGKGRWAGVEWMEAELNAHDQLGLADIARAVRTPRFTGDEAGYGQIVPLRPGGPAQTRVLWHAPIGSIAAPFTPFFVGSGSVPPEFGAHRYLTAGEDARFMVADEDTTVLSTVPQRVEATRSAVHTFKRLLYLLAEHHELFLPEVTPVWEAFEAEQATLLLDAVQSADALLAAGKPELAERLLTQHSTTQALRSLDLGEAMVAGMEARSRVLFGIREELGWRGPEQLW